jgi:hypothetical protein
MHVRVNVVKSGKNVYRYAQVVQNYRNKRGQTVAKVLASFANMPEVFVENLKAAVAASRDNKAVVLAEDVLASLPKPKVQANLRYLDAAVALEIWRRARLGELLDRVLARTDTEVPISGMIAALAIHQVQQHQGSSGPRSTRPGRF